MLHSMQFIICFLRDYFILAQVIWNNLVWLNSVILLSQTIPVAVERSLAVLSRCLYWYRVSQYTICNQHQQYEEQTVPETQA